MINPKLKTKVIHSESKPAWYVVSTTLGLKYKIAQVPYVSSLFSGVHESQKREAREYAEFISNCFNNSTKIYKIT